MAATLDAAQEHRVRRRLIAQRNRRAEQHPAVGDQHLIARIHAQQSRIRPSVDGRVNIGAELIRTIGADARQ
jgi:hypothetical protein